MIRKLELVFPVCPFVCYVHTYLLPPCHAIFPRLQGDKSRSGADKGTRRSWCFARETRVITCHLAQPLPDSQLPLIGLLGAIQPEVKRSRAHDQWITNPIRPFVSHIRLSAARNCVLAVLAVTYIWRRPENMQRVVA